MDGFQRMKKPLDEHVEYNRGVTAANERLAARMIRDLVKEWIELDLPSHRLKPSAHVPSDPVPEMRGTFEQVTRFVEPHQAGQISRGLAWFVFPEDEKIQSEIISMLPDGSDKKDVQRFLLLAQDFWLWVCEQPHFEKKRLSESGAMFTEKSDAFYTVMYLPMQAAIRWFDELKGYLLTQAKRVDEDSGGMLSELKVYFLQWLIYKCKRRMWREVL